MLQKPIDIGNGYSLTTDAGKSEAEYKRCEELFDKLVERIRPIVDRIAAPKLDKLWEELQKPVEKEADENSESPGLLMGTVGLIALVLTSHNEPGEISGMLKKMPGAILKDLYRKIFWSKKRYDQWHKTEWATKEILVAASETIKEWMEVLLDIAHDENDVLTLFALNDKMLPSQNRMYEHYEEEADELSWIPFIQDFESRQILSRFDAMYALIELKKQSGGFPKEAREYLTLNNITVRNEQKQIPKTGIF